MIVIVRIFTSVAIVKEFEESPVLESEV